MYIDVVPNRNSPPAVLLRESVRDGRRTLKRTLANLSALPEEAVAALRVVLRGGRLVEAGEHFVSAVMAAEKLFVAGGPDELAAVGQ